jgi:hypothetical protein
VTDDATADPRADLLRAAHASRGDVLLAVRFALAAALVGRKKDEASLVIRTRAAAGDVKGALDAALALPEGEEREIVLAYVLERMAEHDPGAALRGGLHQKIRDPARHDRVVHAIVAATKGPLLVTKIQDDALRAGALAATGEWEEAEQLARSIPDPVRQAEAHERLASAARTDGDPSRAKAYEARATTLREALPAAEQVASLRASATITSSPERARMMLDEAWTLDASVEALHDAAIPQLRVALAERSGPAVHEAVLLAAESDALIEVFPEIVGAVARAFGDRLPRAVDELMIASAWARATATAVLDAPDAVITTPPLSAEVARALAGAAWGTALPEPDAGLIDESSVESLDDDEPEMTSIMDTEQRRMLQEAARSGADAPRASPPDEPEAEPVTRVQAPPPAVIAVAAAEPAIPKPPRAPVSVPAPPPKKQGVPMWFVVFLVVFAGAVWWLFFRHR